jgi:hypothetical protein
MLEVWSWPTPNGHKVHIAPEEMSLEYRVIPVNIGAGEQFKPEFPAITRRAPSKGSCPDMIRASTRRFSWMAGSSLAMTVR